eukprot:COSAG01_NODE_433_length_17113_cov_23.009757_18_plen_152_part_00
MLRYLGWAGGTQGWKRSSRRRRCDTALAKGRCQRACLTGARCPTSAHHFSVRAPRRATALHLYPCGPCASKGEAHAVSLWALLTGTPNWHALPCSVAVRYADAAVYNWGAQPSVNFPKVLFLSRMILGAIIPEITFRCIPTKERQRLSTDS